MHLNFEHSSLHWLHSDFIRSQNAQLDAQPKRKKNIVLSSEIAVFLNCGFFLFIYRFIPYKLKMLSTRIEFSQNLIQAAANMNAMLVKPAARIRFSDSKDVVDNNEVRQLKTNISTTASPNLNIEEQRLKTFERNWPLTFISARTLAKTGFYYIGPQDQVRCYFCKVEVSQWDAGDNEVTEHSRWSPHCPLLKRRDTPNVPLEPGKNRFFDRTHNILHLFCGRDLI